MNNMEEMKRKILEQEAKKQINEQIRQNKIGNTQQFIEQEKTKIKDEKEQT